MDTITYKPPFYVRLTVILLLLGLVILTLYTARDIIMPFLLSVLFAILLRPLVIFLNRKLKFPHVIAALVSVALFLIVIGSIVYFISSQVSDFTSDWPKIKHNFSIHYEHVRSWVRDHFKVSYTKQNNLIESVKESSLKNPNLLVEGTLHSFSQTLVTLVLIPVYTFLVLIYRNLFKKFLICLIRSKDQAKLAEIITQVKVVIQSYIVGLMTEMCFVAVLTSTGLYFIGVAYPVLLGVITAILNLVPYIGILAAGCISILAALINSTDLSVAIGVIVVNTVVQFIDNNILVPRVVASKVKINALISIIGVIIGNAIAGIMGMFLALPMLAILKVIFDRIEELKPWGLLLGDDMPKTFKWKRLKLPNLNVGNEETKEHEIHQHFQKQKQQHRNNHYRHKPRHHKANGNNRNNNSNNNKKPGANGLPAQEG